jgi:hypothetical protein
MWFVNLGYKSVNSKILQCRTEIWITLTYNYTSIYRLFDFRPVSISGNDLCRESIWKKNIIKDQWK